MLLYHYLPTEYAIDDLIRKRLKVSIINEVNDPFEHFAIRMRDPAIRKAFRVMKNVLSSRNGILCFSATWRNPMLWSHYADRHKGMCLGFEIPDHYLAKVFYSKNRLDLPFEVNAQNWANDPGSIQKMQTLINTKSVHWRYEQEYRLFPQLEEYEIIDGKKMYFCNFGDELKVVEVIVGCRNDLTKEYLQSVVKNDEVKLTKGRMAYDSFRIVRRNVSHW